jgi:hypothetical protein
MVISWNDSMVGSMLHSSQNVLTFWWGFDIKELFPFFMIYVAVPSCWKSTVGVPKIHKFKAPEDDIAQEMTIELRIIFDTARSFR